MIESQAPENPSFETNDIEQQRVSGSAQSELPIAENDQPRPHLGPAGLFLPVGPYEICCQCFNLLVEFDDQGADPLLRLVESTMATSEESTSGTNVDLDRLK